jgi:hypothetical protein
MFIERKYEFSFHESWRKNASTGVFETQRRDITRGRII